VRRLRHLPGLVPRLVKSLPRCFRTSLEERVQLLLVLITAVSPRRILEL
jgi:hypothetical protein